MTTNTLPDFDALWDYGKPAETEAAFRALLPQAQASGNLSYHVQLLTQIARCQGLQRQFEAAHHTLDQVQALLSEALHQARIRYLLERGRVFNSSGKPEEAQPLFLAAWEQGQVHQEDFHAIDAAHMLAIIAPPEQQLDWNLKALALVEQTSDTRAKKWRGSLYNNIGWAYHEQGNYQRALEMFEQALAARQAQGEQREILIAQWCVARALRSLGQVEEALRRQQALLQAYEQSGEQQDGYVYEELAECLLALQRPEEARPYFALAHAALSQDVWLVAEQPARLERLKQLGTNESPPLPLDTKPDTGD
jgi:tetratricopeptide (TPR) repeat protein